MRNGARKDYLKGYGSRHGRGYSSFPFTRLLESRSYALNWVQRLVKRYGIDPNSLAELVEAARKFREEIQFQSSTQTVQSTLELEEPPHSLEQ